MRALITAALASLLCSTALGLHGPEAESTAQRPVVTVSVDGEVHRVATGAASLADLLDELGVTLGPLDRTEPSPRTAITDGLSVRVTRVSCSDLVEEAALPAQTVVLADHDSPAGYTKILARGKDGRVRRAYRVWAKDGEETLRSVTAEQVLEKPVDTVVLRGTRGLPSRGGNWRSPVTMEATAYDPGPRSCGRYASGYTAIGVKARKGVVAVDDRVIPMGARLYIPGYGFAVAADRGSAIKGNRIDLCFATYEEAVRFGRRHVKVYRLD